MITVHGLVRSLHENTSNRPSLSGPWGPLHRQCVFDTVAMAAMRDKRGSVCECVRTHKSVFLSDLKRLSVSRQSFYIFCVLIFERMIYHNILSSFTHARVVSNQPFCWSQNRMFSRMFTAFLSLTKPLHDFRSHIDTLMCPFIVQI